MPNVVGSSKVMKIGILGFQGAFIEHKHRLEELGGVEAVIVKYPEQLEDLSGIILPGGESTTIGKLLKTTGMMEPLRNKIISGMPVWGTCAGMILLAKKLENDTNSYLDVMDIVVKRNAYGTQIDSFETDVLIPEISKEKIPLVFIRAPYITSVGENVKVLCKVDGNIVAVKQDNMFATSFHPELTENNSFHEYFYSMCNSNK